jgi:hypothetical protein
LVPLLPLPTQLETLQLVPSANANGAPAKSTGRSAYRRGGYLEDVEALPVGRGSSSMDVHAARPHARPPQSV